MNVRDSGRQTATSAYMPLRAEPDEFGANLFHVFPDFAFFVRRPQQIGGMKGRDDAYPVDVVKRSAEFRYRRRGSHHSLRGERSETTDDLWFDDGELLFKKRIARSDLVRFGIAIVRWT